MARTLKDKISDLPNARRARVEQRAADLVAEEMSLRELRQMFGETQTDMAARLGVGQHAISKLEARTDPRLSTLKSYIENLGGSLRLVADFPDRPSVELAGLENQDKS